MTVWLALLALLAYINVTRNRFVWDDEYFIVNNYGLRQPLLYLSSQFRHLPLAFRPGMVGSLMLDTKVWGLDPAGFHLTNLLLHLLCVVLVYRLALKMQQGRFFAPLAGLFFALHPVHSEAVASMLGRSDLLITALSLLGLFAYLASFQSRGLFRRGLFYMVALLVYVAACLTKESGIVLPFLWWVTEKWGCQGKRRRLGAQALMLLPLFALGLLYFLVRQRLVPQTGQLAWGGGAWQTALLVLVVLWKYVILLVFPLFLSPYYFPSWPEGWGYLQILGGFLVISLSIVLIIRYHRRAPLLTWASAWMGFALLPVSNIIPIPGAMMAERWLYLPSVGFCILFAWGAHELLVRSASRLRRVWLGFGWALLLLAVLRIVSWNTVWRDEGTLTLTSLRQHPGSALAHNNRGNYLYNQNRIREAAQEYALAYRLNPRSREVHVNIGNIFCARGTWEFGMVEYRKALAIDSTFISAWSALGFAYYVKGELDSALVQYQRVLRLDPLNLEAMHYAGVVLIKKKEFLLAEKCFRRALALAPDDPVLKANLTEALEKRSEDGHGGI